MLNRASASPFAFGGLMTLLLIGVLINAGSTASDVLGVHRAFGFVLGLVLAFLLSRALLRWLSVRALSGHH